jgi:hypothetical protein
MVDVDCRTNDHSTTLLMSNCFTHCEVVHEIVCKSVGVRQGETTMAKRKRWQKLLFEQSVAVFERKPSRHDVRRQDTVKDKESNTVYAIHAGPKQIALTIT